MFVIKYFLITIEQLLAEIHVGGACRAAAVSFNI